MKRKTYSDAVLVYSQPFHLQGPTISFPGVITAFTAEGRVQGFGSPETQLSSEAVGKCFFRNKPRCFDLHVFDSDTLSVFRKRLR